MSEKVAAKAAAEAAEKRATGTSKGGARGSVQRTAAPARKVVVAETADASAGKRSAAGAAGRAGKGSAGSGAVRTSAAAADMMKAAKTSAKPETRAAAARRAGSKSAEGAAATPDDSAVRDTRVSTVQPAEVQQPRVETRAGTANSMTKKLNEVSVDDDATQADEQQVAPGKGEKAKARDRRAKEKALLKDAFASTQPGTAEELEERRSKLRALIKLGKERGFLTYAEINDHLPDNFAETEAIEGIISTFNDMGVAVYEQAPDAETLLLNDNAPAVSSDDEVEEEAEVALSTVDSEFGRTTDPVRMYMREMGTVELLTREGSINENQRAQR
jgi:RNA polymerase primary sigma factor